MAASYRLPVGGDNDYYRGVNMKAWLDKHVVPCLAGTPEAKLHSFLHQGDPPSDVLVFVQAETPDLWPELVRRLLEDGFVFDFTREATLVRVGAQVISIFGGDGTPFFNAETAMVRLYRKVDDVNLMLEVGGRFAASGIASEQVKRFYGLFPDTDPSALVAKYRPSFGAA